MARITPRRTTGPFDFEILFTFFDTGTPCALIDRGDIRGDRFVVAWNFDSSDGTWGQGHYFSQLPSALHYIESHYGVDCHSGT